MAARALKTVVVPPVAGGMPSATVLLLHGLGDTAHGWLDVARMLGRAPALHHVRFVLPTAPVRPVTLNMGMPMTAWFDIYSLTSIEREEDEAGMTASTEAVRTLIAQEADGSAEGLNGHKVPLHRIVVAGFSQGGAIALLCGLTHPSPLAGVAALSTWLPMHEKWEATPPKQTGFPLFQAHGTQDTVVDYRFGKMSNEALRRFGFGDKLSWHEYPMPHSACPDEIRDLAAWLEQVVPA